MADVSSPLPRMSETIEADACLMINMLLYRQFAIQQNVGVSYDIGRWWSRLSEMEHSNDKGRIVKHVSRTIDPDEILACTPNMTLIPQISKFDGQIYQFFAPYGRQYLPFAELQSRCTSCRLQLNISKVPLPTT